MVHLVGISLLIYKYFMNRLYIYLFISVVLVSSTASNDEKGTVGIYVSPDGITRQTEVHQSLVKIQNDIDIAKTTYNHQNDKYTISNATTDMVFLDGKQKIEISQENHVQVFGGKVQFQYRFNFTKQSGSETVNGWAFGTITSDSFNYTKELLPLQDGIIKWTLIPGEKGYQNLTISEKAKIKRIQPYNEQDFNNIQDMLDKATQGINPGNIISQLLSEFNSNMPTALNASLHESKLSPTIEYKFHSPSHGDIGFNVTNNIWNFSVNAQDGYKMVYLSEIEGDDEPCVGQKVPDKPLGFSYYGGHQTIFLNCFYDSVLAHLQKKGWLDITLNNDWDCNAFQFFTGDLFELIPKLYQQFNPRQPLTGQCKINQEALHLRYTRQSLINTYQLNTHYTCSIKSTDSSSKQVQILKFVPNVVFYIDASASQSQLIFKINNVQVKSIEFTPVGDYYINDKNLALFKANEIVAKMKGINVFGTGFPLNRKQYPKTEVREGFVIYFDAHSISEGEGLQIISQ